MERIVIVGTSCSGKTTLGKSLSTILRIDHKEMDAFHWEPNWTPAEPEVFRGRIDLFTQQPRWVIDGNYSSVSDLVWSRATDLIWLDYPLSLILKQFFVRSVSRTLTKEVLWSGNTESFWNSIFSKDSLLRWILKTYHRNKKRYRELSLNKDFQHLKFHHFKNPQDTEEFLRTLKLRN